MLDSFALGRCLEVARHDAIFGVSAAMSETRDCYLAGLDEALVDQGSRRWAFRANAEDETSSHKDPWLSCC